MSTIPSKQQEEGDHTIVGRRGRSRGAMKKNTEDSGEMVEVLRTLSTDMITSDS